MKEQEELLRQIHQIGEDYYSNEHSPGGVSFYEYLKQQLSLYIQQAKQEVAREIFKEIEKQLGGTPPEWWVALKATYGIGDV